MFGEMRRRYDWLRFSCDENEGGVPWRPSAFIDLFAFLSCRTAVLIRTLAQLMQLLTQVSLFPLGLPIDSINPPPLPPPLPPTLFPNRSTN